jgi:hypothetical protein
MMRICVVCEGQTEEEFILSVLAPGMYGLGLNLVPEMISTSPGHRGGALSYDRVKRHLRNTLRQRSAPVVTTLFDLYRLDNGFPSFQAAAGQGDLAQRLQTLNHAFHADVVAEAGCMPDRFIPYIQPYEFEALLFSDVPVLTNLYPGWQRSMPALSAVRAASASPEHINDHPENTPAAHLERELSDPNYRKRSHGPSAAQKIGLPMIEGECAYFSAWLAQLRRLSPQH